MNSPRTNPSQDAALSQGHLEERPIVGHHGEHDAPRFGDIPKPKCLVCALRDERSQALFSEVKYPDRKTRFQEIERHGLAHLTQSNESDTFWHTCFLP